MKGIFSLPADPAASEEGKEQDDSALLALLEEGAALLEARESARTQAGRASLEEENASPGFPQPLFTQAGPGGIFYDFNEGCRVFLPPGACWRVLLKDADTGTVLFDETLDEGGVLQSAKRSYSRFEIIIWQGEAPDPFFHHVSALEGREILLRLEWGGLGDQIAWVGHACAFARRHKAKATCCVREDLVPLFAPAYPDLRFVAPDSLKTTTLKTDTFYATYKLAIFFDDPDKNFQPVDYRQSGLATHGAYILGLTPKERRPDVAIEPGDRPINAPYAVIAVQSTALAKHWNNPEGWRTLVSALKEKGYRVVCIDERRATGSGTVWTHLPHGVEDQTGKRPLAERARWLKHADFFVGLSSGLSWLAWAVGTPVVMISGFTETYNEFLTEGRVINRHACHGCANDVTIPLERSDYFFCPRHKNTTRAFECTRLISPEQVLRAIEKITRIKK